MGQVFDWAPALTLSAGLAAAHQAILGTGCGWPWTAACVAR
ncbi:hypothetical protein I551_1838 [Mycobacterium ulcerans str. Harvey]|uniref:Uncharacterized protein n=1 Tax=Mycobacterium ulcerans str. Harvey TaxID=1299332 RepID=A0ABN0R3J9_MYCUL|nr:hypothetical protein I551_1838 [Mycobacterium ulcerans str. Harvey]